MIRRDTSVWTMAIGIGLAVLLPLALRAEEPKILTNSIGMKLVLISAGEFLMGSVESSEELAKVFGSEVSPPLINAEHPAHRVQISKAFYLGMYEVTVGQFRRFVDETGYQTMAERDPRLGRGWNAATGTLERGAQFTWRSPGFEQTDDHPVINLHWKDARNFCLWLRKKEWRQYRLPTEAEWEYACRAGTTTRYWGGNDPEKLAEIANLADATAKAKFPDWPSTIRASDGYAFTAPVGKFRPNPFGLFDMHGNAAEWCDDLYDANYYSHWAYASQPQAIDPAGPTTGTLHVARGGSWRNDALQLRSASRLAWLHRLGAYESTGFRVALSP